MRFLSVVLAILCQVSALFGQQPTAESVLSRHIAAIGGAEKLRSIQTLRFRGVQVLSPGQTELPILIEEKRPSAQRVELTIHGMTRITTFDGKDGWIKTPWAANKEAEPLKPEEIKALSETDFDTPYLDWQAKGWKAELLGLSDVDGQSVYRVKLIMSNTEYLTGSFDVRTYQELARERSHWELGNEIRMVSRFGEHQSVQGISFPFYIQHRVEYRGRRLKLYIDKVEVNPKLSDQRFAKP